MLPKVYKNNNICYTENSTKVIQKFTSKTTLELCNGDNILSAFNIKNTKWVHSMRTIRYTSFEHFDIIQYGNINDF